MTTLTEITSVTDQRLSKQSGSGIFWPSDDPLGNLFSSTQPEQGIPAGPGNEPAIESIAVLGRVVAQWAEAAISHAVVRGIDDPPGLVATITGLSGPWGFGCSPEEALEELKSVLIDWARLKLDDGDDDIPSMEGFHLVVER